MGQYFVTMKHPLQILAILSASLYHHTSAYEDGCGIYPKCSQYGLGTWQILEDCHKYIKCTIVNGEMIQENLERPGDLVFANEYGPGKKHQDRRLGCFRLAGTMVG